MRIGLLSCDEVPERFRAIAGGYRDMFEALLKPAMPDLEFRSFDVCHGELPAAPGDCEAYLCTGSRSSVYETHEWISKLAGFVRELANMKTPFVGICFGHQMLAQALGGKVARAPLGWGVGIQNMTIVEPQTWMQPALEHCRLQYMHADQVEKLPEGGRVLARAPHCPVAMFSVGENMLGIEGHPEFPVAYARALLEDRRERIGAVAVDAALKSLAKRTDEAKVATWITHFLQQ